ncbi:hypothetical protein MSSAC_4323 [Methanosarcina siciliae C2J]|uniref:DUF1673 domain-containing protein n=2 Tax=Methanosarcina siciliae TaxID=38027 RepID=A0A0E3PIU9_9EURY|nr:DUF1673 domain-containing protein [Methanosarcina siciliae]AKB34513.1 hypothetical protein MSSIH_3823 [Methanosarcina siciliae HI350]AKB38913.1 hypothetical protein MSSAC_4323 [Methanosarcina siciliae C2J]
MPAKTVAFEQIKKLMGWCPYAKASGIRPQISLANFEEYDQSRGEKARSPGIWGRFSSLLSRLDVRILLPTLFLTSVYLNLLFRKGINAESFFLGFSLSLLIYLLCWKKQMRHYDALAKKSIVGSSFKKTFFWVFLALISALILVLILPMFFLSYIPSFLNARSLYSFMAGAWIFMWGSYLQLIYWERKNHMKIYIKSEKGFQKVCALREKR